MWGEEDPRNPIVPRPNLNLRERWAPPQSDYVCEDNEGRRWGSGHNYFARGSQRRGKNVGPQEVPEVSPRRAGPDSETPRCPPSDPNAQLQPSYSSHVQCMHKAQGSYLDETMLTIPNHETSKPKAEGGWGFEKGPVPSPTMELEPKWLRTYNI